jgi:hypothetical protein
MSNETAPRLVPVLPGDWDETAHEALGGFHRARDFALACRHGRRARHAWLRRSEYEFIQHVVIARPVGLTDAEIERGPDAPGGAPADADIVRAVDELAQPGPASATRPYATGAGCRPVDAEDVAGAVAIRPGDQCRGTIVPAPMAAS